MSKSKEIIALEKKLAQAKAKEKSSSENKAKEFTLFVSKGEGEEIQAIQVTEKKLTDIDKAIMVEDVARIVEAHAYLAQEGFDSVRVGFWLKALVLLGEPAERFLMTAFGITDYKIPIFHNLEVLKTIASKNDWLGDKLMHALDNFETLLEVEENK